MKSVYEKKENCYGCTACKRICPTKAIEMERDREGFLYPSINQSLCKDCGFCQKVCPIQNIVMRNNRFPEPQVFIVIQKDEKIRMNSTSGGVYSAMSEYALKVSNVVYGVKFDEEFNVQHARATNDTEITEFRGSKYVQSNIKDIFMQIQKDLRNGLGVLFTGTGCQVVGLEKFLCDTKTDISKLITNDIICHGVPSPLLWEDYLKFIQKRDSLVSYNFRYKEKGWHGYNIRSGFNKGKEKINTSDIKVFANLFRSDLILRPSCYHCRFANLQRTSDITIGDFWGIEKIRPDLNDNRGVSLVMVNTAKGRGILESIKENLYIWQSNTNDCLQPSLQHPTQKPKERDLFWQDYYKYGFEYIAKKYAGYNLKDQSKTIIKSLLQRMGLIEYVGRLINSISRIKR